MADGQANIGLYDIATKQKNVILIADNKKSHILAMAVCMNLSIIQFLLLIVVNIINIHFDAIKKLIQNNFSVKKKKM